MNIHRLGGRWPAPLIAAFACATNRLHVGGGVSATALVSTCNRGAKENFAPVASRQVLEKVATLPIMTWSYKEAAGATHVHPTAQNFYAAFGLGGSDKTITSVDPDGGALAAIQGLNQQLQARSQQSKARSQKLEAENAKLKRELGQLKHLVSSLAEILNGGPE